ncbi:hypothetical protein HUK80_14275 [Flavobacterium sp. MAH-1]|uniref:Uncharacterized protein n=1 Tax=Flavobacterium agri TaxID=2743471 RepID=A0A7Y9C673_9FLAO|nr:hypothetical protein [Flavobacterium agri]NUY82067.1 hypothetical protein [Flavobacterium agri]NYA72091.1 hypothetical protein [Flavobacterium agri]
MRIHGLAGVWVLGLGIVCGSVLAVFIVVGLLRALNDRSFNTVFPSLIGILAICIVIFSPIERILEAMKAERILEGKCEHTVSTAWIVLRKDGTFEYSPAMFLEPKEYEGTFVHKGDSILLSFRNSVPQTSAKMVFRSELGKTYLHGYDSVENVYHDFYLELNKLEK